MSFFGIGWLDSSSDKAQRKESFYKEIFPRGKSQEEKINELLKELFIGIRFEECKYNYIITKQKLMNINYDELNDIEKLNVIKELNSSYLSNKYDASKYMVLAMYDIKIDEQLNYPSIEQLKEEINKAPR